MKSIANAPVPNATRLPMKFGVSLQITTPLPKRYSPNHEMNSTTSLLVSFVGMTSSNFKYRGGLKKCVPRKCFLNSFERPSAISWIGIPEVFVVTIALGLRTPSMRAINSCLIFKFSTMTSTIQSASLTASKSSSRFPSLTSDFNSSDIRFAGLVFKHLSQPSFTILFLSPSCAATSNNVTGVPAFAKCAAIAAPIVPAPMTAALYILYAIISLLLE